MFVEQAIYASADTSRGRGYQLVSRSPGISRDLAIHLSKWSPSHASLLGESNDAESLNYHPLHMGNFVVSRTVFGGREFSQRGGLQVVTLMLVFQREQLAPFARNPILAARAARSLGYLRCDPSRLVDPVPVIPAAELPDQIPSLAFLESNVESQGLAGAIDLLNRNESIALLTENNERSDPVASLMAALSPSQRANVSFTTGLKPSKQRPYRVHVIPRNCLAAEMQIKLAMLRVHCVSV